jgi:hypothetical protein
MKPEHRSRNTVYLIGNDKDGQQVMVKHLRVHTFYENSNPLLDEPEFRKTCHIVLLRGLMYDGQGAISEDFEVRFDAAGLCVGETTRVAVSPLVERALKHGTCTETQTNAA